jgi:hypothetical protein
MLVAIEIESILDAQGSTPLQHDVQIFRTDRQHDRRTDRTART